MGAKPGAVFAVGVPKVILVFVPSLLKCVSSESSIMLSVICCCDTRNIYYIVLLTLSWGQWAVVRPTLAVTALDLLLLLVLLQQLGVMAAHHAAHVGHALVGYFHCTSIEEFSQWVARGEYNIYNP